MNHIENPVILEHDVYKQLTVSRDNQTTATEYQGDQSTLSNRIIPNHHMINDDNTNSQFIPHTKQTLASGVA